MRSPAEIATARWTPEEVDERWEAVRWDEREAWLRFGWRPAPWETPPDYAERILKGDANLTLANAGRLVVIFRAAYDEFAGEGEQ